MTELEMCDTLGILVEPSNNRMIPDNTLKGNIEMVSQALLEMNIQKRLFGSVNPDIWLEFIPWHSLN